MAIIDFWFDPWLLGPFLMAALGIIALGIIRHYELSRQDPIRYFPIDLRRRIISRARGRCEHKPPLWFRCRARGRHADHVIPWSKGGPTVIWNGQWLCVRHNLRKSNRMPTAVYRWRLVLRRRRYPVVG